MVDFSDPAPALLWAVRPSPLARLTLRLQPLNPEPIERVSRCFAMASSPGKGTCASTHWGADVSLKATRALQYQATRALHYQRATISGILLRNISTTLQQPHRLQRTLTGRSYISSHSELKITARSRGVKRLTWKYAFLSPRRCEREPCMSPLFLSREGLGCRFFSCFFFPHPFLHTVPLDSC